MEQQHQEFLFRQEQAREAANFRREYGVPRNLPPQAPPVEVPIEQLVGNLSHIIRIIFMRNPDGITLDELQDLIPFETKQNTVGSIRHFMTRMGWLEQSEEWRMNNAGTRAHGLWYATQALFDKWGHTQ